MVLDPPTRSAACWIAPEQTDLFRAVAKAAGLHFVAAGADNAVGHAGASHTVAESLGCEPITDLRQRLRTLEADVLLIGAIDRPEVAELLDDAEVVRSLTDRGVRTLSLEPTPAHAMAFGRNERPSDPRGIARLTPLLRWSPGFCAAEEVLQAFGPGRVLSISARCGRAHGSLAARLVDAMDAVRAILGEPEVIDAGVAIERAPTGLRLAPDESLRNLRGDLTANLRFADGASASLTLSDRAGVWFRGATILGQSGCIRLDEQRFDWTNPEGEVMESSPADTPPVPSQQAAAQAIASEISRVFDPHAAQLREPDLAGALCMAEAAILSARTGQPESPETIRRMAGLPA